MKKMTVVIRRNTGPELADQDVAALRNPATSRIIRTTDSDLYLHQLRLRVEEDPSLLDQIEVLYSPLTDPDEILDAPTNFLQPIELGEGHEMRWPVGFMQDGWEIEIKITKLREQRRKAQKEAAAG